MLPKQTPEFEFISAIRKIAIDHGCVALGIGDDCSLVNTQASGMLITADMLMDGVHFELAHIAPFHAGRKAMGVNLSDIAAMAGIPQFAVVSLAIPKNMSRENVDEFFRGLQTMADEFKTTIVGGDTNSWDGPLVANVTLIGMPTEHGIVTRSGARPGDHIYVTGTLGGSIHGKHLDFTPRVAEALRLNAGCKIHAMLDISDGLVADLYHILEESDVGAVLDARKIPISQAAARATQRDDSKTTLEHALSDGEDFELLFTAASSNDRLIQQLDIGIEITHIGRITKERHCLLENSDEFHNLPRMGFSHDFAEIAKSPKETPIQDD